MKRTKDRNGKTIVVVHPTFDAPEAKLNGEGLGMMAMSRTVRLCLLALRAYLLLMGGILVYHLLDLAEAMGRHAR